MGLPIQSTPTHECVLPSNGETVKFRPFLVKEQKVLTLARESEDQKQILGAIKTMISAVTFEKVDATKLAMADLEYLFLQVRCVSVGETTKVSVSCNDTECNGSVELNINLEDAVMVGESPDPTVMISDDVGVVLKWPSVGVIQKVEQDADNESQAIEVMKHSIVRIFDENEMYEMSEIAPSEVDEFVENLTFGQLGQLGEYFDNIPKLTIEAEGQCNICNETTNKKLEGINSFF